MCSICKEVQVVLQPKDRGRLLKEVADACVKMKCGRSNEVCPELLKNMDVIIGKILGEEVPDRDRDVEAAWEFSYQSQKEGNGNLN